MHPITDTHSDNGMSMFLTVFKTMGMIGYTKRQTLRRVVDY